MPIAIQYGMTEQQFWHGDLRLLEVYQKAYIRDRAEKAYLQAQYQAVATEVAVSNVLATKKSDKKSFSEIVAYVDPIEKITQKKEPLTTKNLEVKFRQDMIEQQQWLKSILTSKKE